MGRRKIRATRFSLSQSAPILAGTWDTHNISVGRGYRPVRHFASSEYNISADKMAPKDFSQRLRSRSGRLSLVLARGNKFAREVNTKRSRTA